MLVFLSQSMGGFNEALLMTKQTVPEIEDPLAFGSEEDIAMFGDKKFPMNSYALLLVRMIDAPTPRMDSIQYELEYLDSID